MRVPGLAHIVRLNCYVGASAWRGINEVSDGNSNKSCEFCVAQFALCGLERHLRNLASLDPDRWQYPARADAMAQSFLARCSLCLAPGLDHIVHPLSRPQLRAQV